MCVLYRLRLWMRYISNVLVFKNRKHIISVIIPFIPRVCIELTKGIIRTIEYATLNSINMHVDCFLNIYCNIIKTIINGNEVLITDKIISLYIVITPCFLLWLLILRELCDLYQKCKLYWLFHHKTDY